MLALATMCFCCGISVRGRHQSFTRHRYEFSFGCSHQVFTENEKVVEIVSETGCMPVPLVIFADSVRYTSALAGRSCSISMLSHPTAVLACALTHSPTPWVQTIFQEPPRRFDQPTPGESMWFWVGFWFWSRGQHYFEQRREPRKLPATAQSKNIQRIGRSFFVWGFQEAA